MVRRRGGGRSGVFQPVEKWLRARLRHPRYQHVFRGHVVRRPHGLRGSGYHHRHNGWNPPGARVRRDADGMEIILERNPSGTYRARVDVQAADGTWHPKDGSSTFFPDSWHPQRVENAIKDAFTNRTPHPTNPRRWRGQSDGLVIEGSYDNYPTTTSWNSAWPIN
ncbi:EndoU domain-containing protein [Dactylosporangium sp. NPDC050688]|uniref:EndoU domain-containing protein n=1 Tax=Dactylosporangium sp. NPDC050688 TaxID=3157217 RepID=UPI0033D9477B